MSGDEDNRLRVNRDKFCENVNHPLNYYRQKKQYLLRLKKEGIMAPDNLPDSVKPGSHFFTLKKISQGPHVLAARSPGKKVIAILCPFG